MAEIELLQIMAFKKRFTFVKFFIEYLLQRNRYSVRISQAGFMIHSGGS